jgi:hypothetical protein
MLALQVASNAKIRTLKLLFAAIKCQKYLLIIWLPIETLTLILKFCDNYDQKIKYFLISKNQCATKQKV